MLLYSKSKYVNPTLILYNSFYYFSSTLSNTIKQKNLLTARISIIRREVHMKKKQIFKGVATALATPFKDGKIDYSSLKRMIDFQISGGVDAILVCGTTGESPSLGDEETHKLIDKSAELIDGRVKMIVGTGSLSMSRALEQSKFASEHGADGLLVITPFYNKGTKKGIAEYFCRIANHTDKPIIIYNVPSRTGVDISLDTVSDIYEEENIVAIKEASGNIDKSLDLATFFPELFIYSGNDTMTLPILSLGGCGVISVLSNVLPSECSNMCSKYFDGRTEEALSLQKRMTPLMHLMFSDVNPAPVKAALSIIGMCENELRLPLTKVSTELYLKIQSALSEFV